MIFLHDTPCTATGTHRWIKTATKKKTKRDWNAVDARCCLHGTHTRARRAPPGQIDVFFSVRSTHFRCINNFCCVCSSHRPRCIWKSARVGLGCSRMKRNRMQKHFYPVPSTRKSQAKLLRCLFRSHAPPPQFIDLFSLQKQARPKPEDVVKCVSIGEAPISYVFFFGVSFVLYLHFSVVNGQCFMLHLVLVVAFVSEFILSPTALWFSVNFVFDCAFFFSLFIEWSQWTWHVKVCIFLLLFNLWCDDNFQFILVRLRIFDAKWLRENFIRVCRRKWWIVRVEWTVSKRISIGPMKVRRKRRQPERCDRQMLGRRRWHQLQ